METTPTPLSEDYEVSPEQIKRYRQDGHVLLRHILSPEEVAVWRPRIVNTALGHNTENRPLEERDTHGKAFLQTFNLWELDADARAFVLARRFAKIAADLLGVDGVRVYHDQALFKEPGGGPTPWHQDQYHWPLDTTNIVTMWMPLVDASEEMGTLRFATKTHMEGDLGTFNLSDESQAYFEDLVQKRGFPLNQSAMQAGDATFHAGWTLHSAPGNTSDTAREVMTIIYYPDGARITEPSNKHHQTDIDQWMPSLKPGDLAASRLNPLVYSRGAA